MSAGLDRSGVADVPVCYFLPAEELFDIGLENPEITQVILQAIIDQIPPQVREEIGNKIYVTRINFRPQPNGIGYGGNFEVFITGHKKLPSSINFQVDHLPGYDPANRNQFLHFAESAESLAVGGGTSNAAAVLRMLDVSGLEQRIVPQLYDFRIGDQRAGRTLVSGNGYTRITENLRGVPRHSLVLIDHTGAYRGKSGEKIILTDQKALLDDHTGDPDLVIEDLFADQVAEQFEVAQRAGIEQTAMRRNFANVLRPNHAVGGSDEEIGDHLAFSRIDAGLARYLLPNGKILQEGGYGDFPKGVYRGISLNAAEFRRWLALGGGWSDDSVRRKTELSDRIFNVMSGKSLDYLVLTDESRGMFFGRRYPGKSVMIAQLGIVPALIMKNILTELLPEWSYKSGIWELRYDIQGKATQILDPLASEKGNTTGCGDTSKGIATICDHPIVKDGLKIIFEEYIVSHNLSKNHFRNFERFYMVYTLAMMNLYAALKYYLLSDSNLGVFENNKEVSRRLNKEAVLAAFSWLRSNESDSGVQIWPGVPLQWLKC